MSNAPVLVALVTALGTIVAGVTAALFARRKTNADADLTVGEAWQKYVQTQAAEIGDLKRDRDQLRGELKAALKDISVLQRQRNEALFWQAKVTTRDEQVILPALERAGIHVEPLPSPPVMRDQYTRAEDHDQRGNGHA